MDESWRLAEAPATHHAVGRSAFYTVQVWITRTDRDLPQACLAWLDHGEHARLARFVAPGERRRRLAAWCLRRYALSCLLPDVRPRAWRFDYPSLGRPRLAHPFDRLNIDHNLSHGGLYAAVIVAPDPCGIDVERVCNGILELDGALTPEEARAVAASAAPDDCRLVHWTIKEAVLKMAGLGLSVPLQSVRILMSDDGMPTVGTVPSLRALLGCDLRITTWPLPDGHRLAAAYRAEASLPPPLREWVMVP
jgi:4'-phosphopantetheinyl transferase